ncbi:MAG TPA: hypothetical protein VG406_13000 [Isosphaeraceae bacterium]|nr:hypothetical protein [Isosphaeraceae bacterium]
MAMNAAGPLVAGAETPLDRFRGEYPRAAERLERFYGRVSGHSEHIQYTSLNQQENDNFDLSDDNIHLHRKYDFSFLDQSFLIKKYYIPTPTKAASRAAAGTPGLHSPDTIICKNKEYSFILTYADNSKAPVLKLFGNDLDLKRDRTAVTIHLHSPFAILGTPVTKMMNDPNFKVKKAAAVSIGGDDCIQVDYDYAPGDDRGYYELRGGSIVFLPDRCWAIRGFRIGGVLRTAPSKREPVDPLFIGEVDYRGTRDSIPLISKVGLFFKGTTKDICTFENIDITKKSERDFTLTSFGLPEIGEPSKVVRKGRASYWFFGLAALALIVAVALRWFTRRIRDTDRSPR